MDEKLQRALEAILEVQTMKAKELDRLNDLIKNFVDIDITMLLWIRDYCDKHNIPLWKEENFKRLIMMARTTLKEIEETSINLQDFWKSRQLPLRKSDKRSPEDLPEPDLTIKKKKAV